MKYKERIGRNTSHEQIPSSAAGPSTSQAVSNLHTAHGAVLELLQDISDSEEPFELPTTVGDDWTADGFPAEDAAILDWETVAAQMGGELVPSAAHRAVTSLAMDLVDYLAFEHPPSDSDSDADPIEDLRPSANLDNPTGETLCYSFTLQVLY